MRIAFIWALAAAFFLFSAGAGATWLRGVPSPLVGSPLANGIYVIASGNSAIDGSYGWAGQTPRVQMFPFNDFGQSWLWDGSKFSNTTVAGGGGSIPSTESFLADANNGTVTETNPGDTWIIAPVSGSTYRILNNRTGLYLSLSAGVLGMSTTQTVWTIAPQLIQSITLSNFTFTPNVANGTVGIVAVNMNPLSPAFSGSRSIAGVNSGGFHLSGTTLQQSASGGTAAGTYTDFNIVATQVGIPNSPQQISPTVIGGSETCTPGNHGPLRGRTRISHGTIVAEDGCLLRSFATKLQGVACGADPGVAATQSWWQDWHDKGYNAVRVAAYPSSNNSCGNENIGAEESQLDTFVSLAAQTGMYVIIDEHSADDQTDWNANQTFWTAIAPRYANNTNVLYELKNEPSYDNLAAHENASFDLIRNAAPNTTILVDSFENIVNIDWQGILNAQTISYANAAVSWHPYGTFDISVVLNAAANLAATGRPTIMGEYSAGDITPGPGTDFIAAMESRGISWMLWCLPDVDCGGSVITRTWAID